MTIVEKAAAMLEQCGEFTLASVSEEGYPRICVVSKTKSEGVGKLYASTGMASTKVRHFRKNPKASACVYRGGDSITLTGTVEVSQHPDLRRELWLDWFIDHYPGGVDDPNYCVLIFTAEEATLWIDQEFVTLEADKL